MDTKNKNLLNKSLCGKKTRSLHGFTLVELIVVITILTILGTIGFTQMQGYSSSARDSVRTSDFANLTKGLEVFQIKTGSYPVPVNPVVYTGGISGGNIVSQGTLNGSLVGFSVANPSDPLTKTSYVYSILGNGSYYQIGAELENPISGIWNSPNIINQTFADGIKTPLLKGNYTSDPSLPSLVVVPGSVPTTTGSGGIFSPEVCFVTGGASSNTLSSGTGSCIKKKAMSLKNSDSALVGYWDMETTFLSGGVNYLKDLSGNGNDGVFSGGMSSIGSLTGGIVGMGRGFGALASGNFIEIPNSNSLNISGTGSSMTSSILFKVNSFPILWQSLFRKGEGINCSNTGCSDRQYGVWVNSGGYVQSISTPQERVGIAQVNGPTSIGTITSNNWYIIHTTIDSVVGKLRVYINGVQQIEIPYGKSGIRSSTGSLVFPLSSYGLDGYLDDATIYNRALSDSEIRQQARAIGF